jgi:type I site-specific restriction endonuclease
MSVSESIGRFVSRLLYTIKSEAADWQKANASDLEALRREKAVAEAELRHRLEMMEIRFTEECRRIRLEEERQTMHFAEFLASIDEMKTAMLTYYASMPKPLALMIHHHAAELLKEAWHNPDARERLQKQTRFTDLMLRITEDLTDQDNGAPRKALPEKTLAFIQNQIEA